MNTTIDDLIKMLSRPKTRSIRTIGSPVDFQAFAGYEPPSFSPSSVLSQSRLVGHLGGMKVHVDPMLKMPRQVVSKKFRETFPELADDLQKWMNDFFGYEYPIYVLEESNTILLHPDTLRLLHRKLARRA